MELEQIEAHLNAKAIAAEIRPIEAEESAAKDELLSKEAASGVSTYEEGKKSGLKLRTLRQDQVYENARDYATQVALSWRYSQINKLIEEKYAATLGKSFTFAPFIQDGSILVPSLLISTDDKVMKGDELISVRASYYVDEVARLRMNPPTYRDYLIKDYPMPSKLHPALLPKNEKEEALWEKGREVGWALGNEQANDIFKDNFKEMVRDIDGRVNYLSAVSLNMISKASLKEENSAVTFNGNTMNVGQVVLTISDPAKFMQMDNWKSAWAKSSWEVNRER